jgi:hypothetical protein
MTLNRRAFLFAIPVLAAAVRAMGGDLELLRRCKVRALEAFLDFGRGTPVVLHGEEAIVRKVPPCDTCGVLPGLDDWRGWTLARDEHETEPDHDGSRACVLGALKAGCPAHPAKSITYDRSGAIDTEEMERSRRFHAEVLERWARERKES